MKAALAGFAASDPQEAASIFLSLSKVRILYYAGLRPFHRPWILEHLRSHGCHLDVSALNRILLRMARNGWLKSTNPKARVRYNDRAFCLTPKGRAVFNIARRRLKELVATDFEETKSQRDPYKRKSN